MPKLNIAADANANSCVWSRLKQEAAAHATKEPALSSLIHATILEQENLGGALVNHLSEKLATQEFSTLKTRRVLNEAIEADPSLVEFAAKDLLAVRDRDPAAQSYLQAFMYFKGYMAIQTHRCAHSLGNIKVGSGAKIGAGSVVLKPVEENCIVAGVPAKPVGGPCCGGNPADSMNQNFGEDL